MNPNKLFQLIDERQEGLFSLLSSFIQFNTENYRSHGNEQSLAEHIHQLCLEMGLESELYLPLKIVGFEQHPDYRNCG